MFLKNKKKYWITTLITASGFLFYNFKSNDRFFEIAKNIEMFCAVFKEVNTNYVDEVDPNKMMKKGIDAMLKDLDPYTVYYSEDQIEDARFMQTGKYAGIGATVKNIGEYIAIEEPYENSPAEKAGLQAGDIIIEIDGKSVKNRSVNDVSTFLRGQAGSSVKLLVKLQSTGSTIEKVIVREEIKLKSVPYSGMVSDNVGYIHLTSFTQNCSKEVKDALMELKKNPKFQYLVLDLRDNGGGLLNEAVEIVNTFVDKGQEVVYTKGRLSDDNHSYKAQSTPLDTKIPIVVLVNSMSASASEIVSGCIQDLDRGVIIGERSYGKGLVQNTKPIAYNTQVKITTAKYYIPSGRCIQAKDYSHRREDGSVESVPDSLIKPFKTKNGRTVYDGGGILPDIYLDPLEMTPILKVIAEKDYIFQFAGAYIQKHPTTTSKASTFQLTDADYQEFIEFMNTKNSEYETESEEVLDALKETSQREHYYAAIEQEFLNLKKKLDMDKKGDLQKAKSLLIPVLTTELAGRYFGAKGRTENAFLHDIELKKAIETLNNASLYQDVLTGKYVEKAKKKNKK